MTTSAPRPSLLRRRVLRTVRSSQHLVGRLTSGARVLPDFLIVGAQRCGTTSMYKALSQHPAMLPVPLQKGVHYFDKHYDRGGDWYRAHFPLQRTAQRRAAAVGGAPLTGESSPYYMFHPLAGERIARDLPQVKLLVLLRDPVERAYSAHAHELARGYESEPFERAIELEPGRLAGECERLVADPSYDSPAWQHNAYLTRGQYIEQLRRLEALVGRARLLVVDSAAFFGDPEPTFAAVLDFLGLPRADGIAFERHNARGRSPMPESLRTRLEEHFAPYDTQLADWWGQVPHWRR